jgi:DNA-binding CsgD family transcriptional regulator
MAALAPGAVEIAVEVAGITSTPGSVEARAEALLEPLRRVVPFQAARISLFDPEQYENLILISRGFPAGIYSPAMEEVELVGLNRSGPPIRLRDLPIPPTEVPIWAEWLWPAGFREGVAVALYTPEGRHVGLLSLITDTPAHPTDAARDLIGRLAPLVATAVDPTSSITAAARVVRDAEAGMILTRAGNALPLPGLPGHPLLTTGSQVLAVVAQQLARGPRHVTFLVPDTRPGTAGSHLRVSALDCAGRRPDHLRAVVLVSPPGDLHGLTSLQLQILGMLIEGWSDTTVAGALTIPDGAVASHIEDILAKLAAPARDLAVLRAVRHGLHVPPPLSQTK